MITQIVIMKKTNTRLLSTSMLNQTYIEKIKEILLTSIILIFISLSIQGQDCTTGLTNLPSTTLQDEINYQSSSVNMTTNQIVKFKVPIETKSSNTFKLNLTNNNSSFTLDVYACGDNNPIYTNTSNFNTLITLPNNIFNSGNCVGEFLFQVSHSETANDSGDTTFVVNPIIVTPIADCPSEGEITLSDNNANTTNDVCEDMQPILLGLTNVLTADGSPVDLICLKGGGNFTMKSNDGVETVLSKDGNGNTYLDPTQFNEGTYELSFSYDCTYGVDFTMSRFINVYENPVAVFTESTVDLNCSSVGDFIYLNNYLDASSSSNGTYSVIPDPNHPADTLLNNDAFIIQNAGTYQFVYTASSNNSCSTATNSDIITFNIGLKPEVDIELGSGFPSCIPTAFSIQAPFPTTATNDANRFKWLVKKNGVEVHTQLYCPGDAPQDLLFSASAPGANETVIYDICLEITKDASGCAIDADDCTASDCETFSIYNDGAGCSCEAPSHSVCYANDQSDFKLGCTFLSINLFTLIDGTITPAQDVYNCSDASIVSSFQSSFAGITVPENSNQTKIEDLPVIGTICDVFNFCICIGWPVNISWRPLEPLYNAIQCNKTLSQAIFDYLGSFAQGSGGKTVVVADTDGDGSFDYMVHEGDYPLTLSNQTIPNNLNRSGEISLRMVSGWPNPPADICGEVNNSGKTLTDVLPLGFIPVIGDVIEEVIQTAGCDMELQWSDAQDKKVYIKNTSSPDFVNCPTSQTLVFSEDYSCNVEANWSIPIAKDACDGEILSYYASPPTNTGDYYGVWQVQGPTLGSSLPVGIHTVEYLATGCNGNTTSCSFYIEVGPGDPVLLAPGDITYPTNYGYDDAVITGISPLSGAGCNTTISYSATGATTFTGSDDASGHVFNLGTTAVEYTMSYLDASNATIVQTQSFNVTIVDETPPIPLCGFVEKTLNNNGLATVNAAELDAGSFDNVTTSLSFLIQEGNSFVPSISFDCMEEGINYRTLMVSDEFGNSSTCIATIEIKDFFSGYEISMDFPELCLEATNPEQLDFSNYLQIIEPGTSNVIFHENVGAIGPDVHGGFFITEFRPSDGINAQGILGISPDEPGETGYIDPDTGIYTPGTSSGMVTIAYFLYMGDQISMIGDDLLGCYTIAMESFELRQPLELDPPTCQCGDFTHKFVDLGIVTGGLEPYTIQYTGGKLDIDSDGIADDMDGEYTFDMASGYDLFDYKQDLGQILMEYTTNVWSITIVDSRGCEIFSSESCDNADVLETPTITCPADIGVVYTDPYVCSSLQSFTHPDIFSGQLADNCVVDQYIYYIKHADGSSEGPYDLQPLLNIDADGNLDVDPELFDAEHHFGIGVSTVHYYAADATGNSVACSFTVTVEDNLSPVFINCPYPEINMTTENDNCYAYVNFSLPLAEDNCDVPTVVQIDNTGLTSGSAFPEGTTVMTWEATDLSGNTETCSITVNIIDEIDPVAICQDVSIQLNDAGEATIYSINSGTPGEIFIDANSWDNCQIVSIEIAKYENGATTSPYSTSQDYNCEDIGVNQVQLLITDSSNNTSTCLSNVTVLNFFDGVQLALDAPEICLADNNSTQYDLTNYLVITLPDGTVISHQEVADHPFFGVTGGSFGITTYDEDAAYPGTSAGTISPDGIYTPGDGSGFVTFNYSLTIPGSTPPQNGNDPVDECMLIVHETFELRQALDMGDPMCLCGDFTERTVELGVLSHGLEPYTIYYDGTRLDVDGDGVYDDTDGEYTYNQANGHNESDFQENLGILRVDYTQPTWSITVVDARGCTIARSGSCDNDDASEAPSITCPDDIGIVFTDYYVCTSNETWLHPDILSGGIYDNCMITEYNFTITNPDGTIQGPFDLDPLLNIYNDGTTNVDVALFNASYDFPKGVSTVFYYVEDATGNFMECTFTVTVEDNLDPIFINCPYPPVVENTETDHCDAYVNFALPLAEDNCDVPTVVQIDNTGLTSGDRFPAGTTIMYWEATDLSGNKDTCQVKVIVNDYWNIPEINCPEDVLQTTDDWRCDAVVYNIGADISSVCQDNLSLTYEIFADEALTDRIRCGVGDASGEIFDKGDTWVKYNVSSQPLLLISEISQGSAIDQLEIVNLGPAAIDINCLEVVRTSIDPNAIETLPMVTNLPALTPTVLASGDVMVFEFSYDALETTPACYAIQYMGNVIDQVAVNGASTCNNFTGVLNGGNVYRHCEADTDDAADWAVEENCSLLTIGLLNPTLDALADNGTITSLQSEPASSASCSFQVTILDDEDPFCGELDPNTNTYSGAGLTDVNEDQCNQSTIEITDACIIGQMSLDLSGTVDVSNADITLISPEGDRIPILSLPYDLFNDLYTIKSEGIWTLDIAPNTSGSFTLEAWSLEITCMNPFEMDDVVLSNDPGVCGAQFDWIHPWLVDNCKEGSISVEYLSDDAACTPEDGQLTAFGGYDVSEFFCVGTTTVLYTLIDEAGNDHQCSFDVTVNDTEAPVVECPADMIFNLDGGLCDITVCYEPLSATDNCAVTDTIFSIEPCTAFDIGLHTVDITILDEAGNSDMCSFTIEVIEYVPNPYTMVCNDLVNVSLGADCLEELNADMLLEGNNYHCYDDYEITITDMIGFPIPNSPFVDVNDVGENFLVMVLDPDSGNFCWSQIHVQDYNNPIIECPADITVKCFDSTDEATTGSAILTSCEASIEWIVNDVVTDLDECDHVISELTRTFTAVDESGNSSSCSHTISIERILLEDVDFPANFDGFANPAITCGDLNSNPELTDPSSAGSPTAFGSSFDQEASCGLSIVMEDLVFNLCGGTYDILRLWSVYDPCLPAQIGINPIQHLQVIKVKDQTGASITCPTDVTISVDAGIGCNTDYLIPPATITDACSDYEVITSTLFGSMYSNGGLITDIPKGTFEVNYQVIDDCGNTSSCEYNLEVTDAVTPDMVCIQFKEVVLNSAGTAIVDFEVFDNGSHDNCCLETLEVARMDDQVFSETVSFDCSDDVVMVILRGTDCYGNTNQCMTEVDVEDKLGPNLLCPDNTSIDCNVYFEELGAALDLATEQMAQDPDLEAAEAFAFLDNYGPAMVVDNCEASMDLSVTYTIDQCGEGAIIRNWTAVDEAGNNALPCTQTISIEHESSWTVNFPEDWTGELEADCSVPDPQFGEAVISEDDCEMVAVSYTDDYYYTTNIGCYKIIRTWTAINWCTYSGTSQENAILVSAGDNIYSVSGDDYVTHVQTLDIYDTQAPVIEETGDIEIEVLVGCDLDVTIPAPTVLGECSTYDYQVTSTDLAAFGSNGVYAEVPLGTYSLTYEVNDDCGNISYWTTDVVLTDGKKPTPYCIDELVVEIMPDGNGGGMASVNATDFNFGSFDNCTDADQLQFSLSADITQTTQDFDCSHIGVQTIELHVWDEAGNTDFCVVALDVQDNMNACSTGSLTVAGALNTEEDEAIEFATVSINGGLFTYETGVDGAFVFDALETGEDYTIAPTLDLDPTNGVSTLDIVFITKHILGMDLLDSPYQLIAADANNSGTISTLDLVAIRKLILTLNLNFPNNQSWRFIDADYVFPDPTNPWATGFPEVISINNIDADQDVNFIGIKIGDVNGSAQSHSFMPAEDRDENHPFIIQTADQDLIPGQTYRVSLSANQASLGFQFTLNFDEQALRLVETYYSILNEEHIGLTNLSYGAITASWNDAEERLFDQDELITFEFEALKAGKLSELISLNSRITAAEAYSNTYPIQSVELWIGEQANQRMELYQNVPNPFSKVTRIPFFLPEDAEVKLSIRHINGQLVKSIEGNYEKGNNDIILQNIPRGIYYYTLEVDRYLITKKMVRL